MSSLALMDRVAYSIENELNLVIKSKEEAKSLQSQLQKIHSELQKAETEGVTCNAAKEWLKEVHNVVYEMEDVLDEGEMLDLQVMLQGGSPVGPSTFVDKVILYVVLLCTRFEKVRDCRPLTKKMKNLSARIDKLLSPGARGKNNFVSGGNSDRPKEFMQEASTSLVDMDEVYYGRDYEKESLVRMLTTSAPGGDEKNTQVVSIVGVGGLGKTTLAQLAYNDDKVDGCFKLKGWVAVSEPFDALKVAEQILEQFGESCAEGHYMETRAGRIKKVVANRKFLLVLDNVLTESEEKWRNLKNCLDGARGSRILVTTWKQSAARMMGATQQQPLNLLSDSDCSQILNGKALRWRSIGEREKLRGIGDEIAKKCKGLPLAARSVGSMLAFRSSQEDWRAVRDSPLWTHEEVRNDFRVFYLSYTDLSPTLKQCFLSTKSSLVSRGFISSDTMIRIWMAYGYLSSKDGYGQVMFKGNEYVSALILRSFLDEADVSSAFQNIGVQRYVQDIHNYFKKERLYRMHDILQEFASNLIESEYSLTIDGRSETPGNPLLNSTGKLRTFFATDVSEGELLLNTHTLSHLKCVRLLSLRDCNLQSLPEGVGKLLHLRYLDLSYNPIKQLPETVCNLYNLQTLGIESCKNLSSLPEGIDKLINLRHLLNEETDIIKYPQGIEQLTDLWTLGKFSGSNLGCLEKLNQLQGFLHLRLSGLKDIADGAEQVRKAKLEEKEHLQKLRLEFEGSETKEGIVEALQPPPNLQALFTISNGKWLSHWVHKSFMNLTHLSFFGDGTEGFAYPPPFAKLPALENLIVGACPFECLSTDFLGIGGDAIASSSAVPEGGFPRLKTLRFVRCEMWKKWEDIKEEGAMRLRLRRLEELEIIGSHELEFLPLSLLRQATSLEILHLSGHKLFERYNEFGGYDHHKISYIRKVIVDNIDDASIMARILSEE